VSMNRSRSPIESRSLFSAGSACALAVLVVLSTCGPALSLRAAETELPPNVVFIILDDVGYGELSCQDPATDAPTPRIDSVAAEGVRFTQAYVTAPFCAASRAGLLTGRYQTRFGFEFNFVGARNEEPGTGLPPGERTLADLLRDGAGYSTALVGKWHLGGTAPFHPQRRGFDEFFGFLHEGHYYRPAPYAGMTTWLRRRSLPGGGEGRWTSADGRLVFTTHMGSKEPDYDANNPVLRNGQPVEEPENLTDAFSREAVDFIRRCGGERPFFLQLAYSAVHSPMQAEPEYLERFAHIEDIHRRIFAAMLAQLDDGVGRVLDALEEEGLAGRTFVALFSDNGGAVRELTSRNDPLRGEKGQLYEGGVRVPFLLRFPDRYEGGQVIETPVSSLDLVPTALALAGLEAPEGLDGLDLGPALEDGGAGVLLADRPLYWRMGARAALRLGEWKIVRHGAGRRPARAVAAPTDPWELYHLSEDPAETRDLAESEPARLDSLIEAWETLDAGMVEAAF